MTAPERIWLGKWWSVAPTKTSEDDAEYVRADLAAVPAQVIDPIHRMDAIQACQVGPSDEWSKATKSGYEQAATDCQRNILRIKPAAIEPQPDPRDEVIARLVEALDELADLTDDLVNGVYTPDSFTSQPARAAIAAVKGGGS